MVKTALKNPYAVIVFALAIFVIGVTAISKLPTDILPTFKTPAVQVVTFYPGMPAAAKVEDSHQIQTNIVRVQGKRQVYIPIYRQPGANTIAVVEGIKAQLKPILERIKGINLDVVMDQSVYVRQAIRNLVREAALGFLLAAAMVFIFLGSARPTGIVLVALPLAVLGALIGLYFTHQTLNAMTLGGIAVVIGLLIDESIVVLENTARHLDLGVSPREAALV